MQPIHPHIHRDINKVRRISYSAVLCSVCCWWCVYESIPATYLCASVRKRALTFAHTEGKGEKRRKKEKEPKRRRETQEFARHFLAPILLLLLFHSKHFGLPLQQFFPSLLALSFIFTSFFFGAPYLYISFTPLTFPQEFLRFLVCFNINFVHKGEKAQTHGPRQTIVQGIKEAIRLTCIIFSAIHLVIDVHC